MEFDTEDQVLSSLLSESSSYPRLVAAVRASHLTVELSSPSLASSSPYFQVLVASCFLLLMLVREIV